MATFCVLYCKTGHRHVGTSEPTGLCSICGKDYFRLCKSCGSPFPSSFPAQPKWGRAVEPVQAPPPRPARCVHCGKPLPWSSWHRRGLRFGRECASWAWREFKGLSKTHLIVLAVILLLIVGAIRFEDIRSLFGG